MAWTTGQVTQNGNTTGSWTISGGSLSTADAVVVRPTSGSSGIRVNSVTTRLNPTRYEVSVTVSGAGAMAFKFSAEEMD
jgi:archaellin